MSGHTQRGTTLLAISMLVWFMMTAMLPVRAGNLDSPGAPTDTASKMHTLQGIYNRFDTGAEGAKTAFSEPTTGPTVGTGRTLNEVMGKAPAVDANAAGSSETLSGKTFWGLSAGQWGLRTGSMPIIGALFHIYPGTTTQTITRGYHDGTGSVAGDADLVTGNIRSGADIFGVVGDSNVVNTSSGDALTTEILTGKKAWVDGNEITGSMANIAAQTITPVATTQTITRGYHDGSGAVAGDANLVSANIRFGANIFGVAGDPNVLNTPSVIAQTITPGTTTQTITLGYHDGSGAVAGDANLVAGNIRSGANIFGVAGDSNVANTSSGDALTSEILIGKKAWVDGSVVSGAMPTQALSDANDTVAAGYYTTTTLSAEDADLTTGNIKSGMTIFGVSGDPNVVDTASGDALATEILTGEKAWVDGAEVTGTGILSANPSPISKSGQTNSYSLTGSDGHLEKGVAWPNPRFTDNSDGTVTDNLTGLIWLKDAYYNSTGGGHGLAIWANALLFCNALNSGECGLSDGSIEGDWCLPNIREMQSLLNYGSDNPALPSGHPFRNTFLAENYWTSTTYVGNTDNAWNLSLRHGFKNHYRKSYGGYRVWPVRSGQ